MGHLIEQESLRDNFSKKLDSLSRVYSKPDGNVRFMKLFMSLNEKSLTEIIRLSQTKIYEDSDLEDIADHAGEVFFYYESIRKKYEETHSKLKKYGSFTLRDSNDLVIFEEFLDRMLKLLDLSPGHFLNVFPKCPVIFWDKIDDLRETSFKIERDSEEYTRCLMKCKIISQQFSKLSGINTNKNE